MFARVDRANEATIHATRAAINAIQYALSNARPAMRPASDLSVGIASNSIGATRAENNSVPSATAQRIAAPCRARMVRRENKGSPVAEIRNETVARLPPQT